MKYPANNNSGTGEQVNYSYHPQMLLNTVGGMNTYVRGTDYDSSGRVQLRRMGTTLQVDYAYYNWTATNGVGRLQYIWGGTSSDADSLQKLYYTYDAVGNVKTIKDYLAAGGTQTQTFGYDALERLTGATATGGSGGTYSESYVYANYTGNLSSKGGVSYAYNDPAHKHAVTHLGGVQKYWYDANGNMITRIVGADTYSLTYDVENRLTQVKKNGAVVAAFTYDGDGKRVKSVVGATTTAFVGSYLEWTGSTSTMVKYYYAGATRLAMRVGTNAPSYLLGDHLGSTSITADGAGNKIAEMRYLPWGGQRYANGTTPTSYRFTGQRLESSIGLYDYGARFYDPQLSRFLSPDSIIPQQQGVQAFDRYAYVSNNPTNLVDPTGHGGSLPGSTIPKECIPNVTCYMPTLPAPTVTPTSAATATSTATATVSPTSTSLPTTTSTPLGPTPTNYAVTPTTTSIYPTPTSTSIYPGLATSVAQGAQAVSNLSYIPPLPGDEPNPLDAFHGFQLEASLPPDWALGIRSGATVIDIGLRLGPILPEVAPAVLDTWMHSSLEGRGVFDWIYEGTRFRGQDLEWLEWKFNNDTDIFDLP